MEQPAEIVRWRDRARPWFFAVVTIALAVVITALVGGFRPAPPDQGPELPADQVVSLRRWDVEVRGCEYTDQPAEGEGYTVDPVVRVGLVLTWHGEESVLEPGAGVIDVVIGDEVQDLPYTQPVAGRSGDFDPDISRAVLWEFPRDEPPGSVTVVLRDEGRTDSFIYDEAWAANRLVGHVALDCPDRRQG